MALAAKTAYSAGVRHALETMTALIGEERVNVVNLYILYTLYIFVS